MSIGLVLLLNIGTFLKELSAIFMFSFSVFPSLMKYEMCT